MTANIPKPPTQRQLRVGEQVRHILAGLFLRGDLHDPDLHDVSVTVTEVRISPDLKNATAFVMTLAGTEIDRTMDALRRAAPFLRSQIAKELSLRYAPRLSFQRDTSFDYAQKIDRLLHSDEVARDVAAGQDDDPADDDGEPGRGA